MDEPESSPHIAILDLGVNRWNDWRLRNPAVQPQLSSTDLTGRQLGMRTCRIQIFLGPTSTRRDSGEPI
jgi:hypothetical protein